MIVSRCKASLQLYLTYATGSKDLSGTRTTVDQRDRGSPDKRTADKASRDKRYKDTIDTIDTRYSSFHKMLSEC